jgi:hypothetical protein
MYGNVERMEEKINVYVIGDKAKGKETSGRPGIKWAYNMKPEFGEILCGLLPASDWPRIVTRCELL